MTDAGIKHLAMSPSVSKHLAVLEVDNCPMISDTSLEYLVSFAKLRRIDLFDCPLVTRNGIRRLRVRNDEYDFKLPI